MAQRTGLGKGLEALLGDVSQDKKQEILEIPIGNLDPNRAQARKQFKEEQLQELADSIRISGVIQPLIVVQKGDRYMIVAGERRFRAARIAGLQTLPVLVRKYDNQQLMEVSLIENLQRQDLNPIEEAAGIKLLMEEHDLTQEEVSKKLGKSRPAIANSVRLLTLPEEILEFLRSGQLTAGHARAIVPIEDKEEQLRLANEIVKRGLPVRSAEQLAKPSGAKREKKEMLDSALYDVATTLQEALKTRVTIAGNSNKGKIVIDYYSQDELERLYEILKELE